MLLMWEESFSTYIFFSLLIVASIYKIFLHHLHQGSFWYTDGFKMCAIDSTHYDSAGTVCESKRRKMKARCLIWLLLKTTRWVLSRGASPNLLCQYRIVHWFVKKMVFRKVCFNLYFKVFQAFWSVQVHARPGSALTNWSIPKRIINNLFRICNNIPEPLCSLGHR